MEIGCSPSYSIFIVAFGDSLPIVFSISSLFTDSPDCLDCDDDDELSVNSNNRSWDYACRDGGFTENECNDFKNNPVDLEHESLKEENTSNCFYDGFDDGKADRPFNKDRSSACSEYGSQYRSAYQSGCESDSTEESCELTIEGEESYCPHNPDNIACVEFLHNATNKRLALTGTCAGMGDLRTWVICPQEADPERYCLNTNDPVFCKTIGDICDAGGFVRPEYPYCKGLEREYSIPYPYCK